jgi:hypothetical protein
MGLAAGPRRVGPRSDPPELAAAQAGEAAAGAVAGVGDGGLDARVDGGAVELRAGEVDAGGADAGEAGDVLDGHAAWSVSSADRVGSAGLRRVATLFADELVGALVSKLRYAERASGAGVALQGDAAGGPRPPQLRRRLGASMPDRAAAQLVSNGGEESLILAAGLGWPERSPGCPPIRWAAGRQRPRTRPMPAAAGRLDPSQSSTRPRPKAHSTRNPELLQQDPDYLVQRRVRGCPARVTRRSHASPAHS